MPQTTVRNLMAFTEASNVADRKTLDSQYFARIRRREVEINSRRTRC